jgi:hypothetical protein
MSESNITARCACGQVVLAMHGAPIVSVACYCDDCQTGARKIEALPNAAPVKNSDGGTSYLAFRKDRMECSRGQEHLQSLKIRPDSATKRVVATCCNSAMYLGFDDRKHWVDVYHLRVQGAVPPIQMRICTRYKPGAAEDPGSTDVPGYPGYPFKLIARLLAAGVAMWLPGSGSRAKPST